MPWQEVKPMDQRVLFIADYLRQVDSFSGLCRRYGISRKTGYKWVGRYRAEGIEGLEDQSRRPRGSSLATPYAIREAVVELRTKGPEAAGPKKIRALLEGRFPGENLPSKTTIYKILKARGLIEERRRRHRVPPQRQPFAPVRAPNEVWSTDFKGQFKMGDGQLCYPLTVMDHDSRFLLGCKGLESVAYAGVQPEFERLFREYGLPWRMRSDNGVPFATRSAGGLSRLSIWWIRLGITPERIEPGKPQQNGRHERMHLTLKSSTTRPPAENRGAQQKRFDRFIEQYNEERPHEALGQKPPVSCYEHSSRPFPERLPELEYPSYFDVQKVCSNGIIYWRGLRVYVSHKLDQEWVGLEPVGEALWGVYFGPVRIGGFDEREVKGKKEDYLTLKL